jgi:hypothetical protein
MDIFINMSHEVSKEKAEVKRLNHILIGFVTFSVIYVMIILTQIAYKQEQILDTKQSPVIAVDPITLQTVNTNIIHPQLHAYASNGAATVRELLKDTPETNGTAVLPYRPMFTKKNTFEVGDYVIINYFHVQGIVLETQGELIVVMYRDHNRTLQTAKVPKNFLLVPTSNYAINPLSLLID